MLGIALIVATLLIALWMPQLARQGEGLRETLAMQAAVPIRKEQPARPRLSLREQTNEFVSAMPPLSQSADDLSTVFEIAERRKLTLPKGEYKLTTDPGTSLTSYTVTLPVRSDYGELKGFSADVLEALPHGSMDELRMTRSNIDSNVLDAVVRFTLVYRSR